MKILNNRLFVEVEGQYREEVDFINGTKLIIPADYSFSKRRICFGTVIGVPEKMLNMGTLTDNYFGHNHTDIAPTVKVGDKVYFYGHYNDPSNWIEIPELLSDPNSKLLNLDYEAVICFVRENKIETVGSHVLLTALKQSEEEISRPAKTIFRNDKGEEMLVDAPPLWTQTELKPKELEAIVSHIGLPLKCYSGLLWSTELHDYVVQVGDKVLITTYSDFTMEIEGNNYYVCRQTDIVAVFAEMPETNGLLDVIYLSGEIEILSFGYHCIVEVLNATASLKNGIFLNEKQVKKQEGLLVRVIEVSEHCEYAEKGKIYRAIDKLIKIQDLCFIQEQFLQYEILN